MWLSITRRRYLISWQLLLLAFGTSWLWAPLLNPGLSDRLSLISDYETAHQPYAWLFRSCDAIAGLLVMGLAWVLLKRGQRTVCWLLMITGVFFLIDPLLPTTCHQAGKVCQGSSTFRYLIHGIESVGAGIAVFITVVYDSIRRKKLLSWLTVTLQVIFGTYFLVEIIRGVRTNTAYQLAYEAMVIVWLAWYGRDFLVESSFVPKRTELNLAKNITAGWAFLNGIFAILVSLVHLQLAGRFKGLYFAGDNAWLAQHGVIIGVIMLYISRHLARGEQRARQIFLVIVGIEVIKYSVITPSYSLLALYSITFMGLFLFRDDFYRGTLPMTWTIRLKDFYYMLAGLLLASGSGLLVLDRDDKTSVIASRAFSHFTDYVSHGNLAAPSQARAVLLAHTISVFLVAAVVSILWILFRPSRLTSTRRQDYPRVEKFLSKLSNSTEDYFKVWPHDKQYWWSEKPDGFIAYKIAGSAAFALADPVSTDREALVSRFVNWSQERRLKACFLPVYPESTKFYESADLQLIQIGSSAVIDIRNFSEKTSSDKWWRWQKNRADKKGYVFSSSAPPHPKALMRQLKRVSDNWLKVGGHSEYGFALGHFDSNYLDKCHLYYLMDSSGRVIAFANRVPLFTEGKTATVDLLRYLPEFNNAMPFLLYKAIESIWLKEKNYDYFDLGFVPFAKSKGPVMAIARTLGGAKFSARGLEQFKNKFDPVWQPNYMAYDGDLADLATIAVRLEQAMGIE